MNRMIATILAVSCIAPLSGARISAAMAATTRDQVSAAIASADRPDGDKALDAPRKASALLVFADIRPGSKVADILPGKGYFTRLFSNIVGPTGHVYAVLASEFVQKHPDGLTAINDIAKNPAFPNVTPVVVPLGSLSLPSGLDVAWTSDNYHDVYGVAGADGALAMDRAVFAALKPGGMFIVIDHAANPGTDGTAPTSLHRIDPETIKKQVQSAGFTLDATSDVLRNSADTHDLKVFDPGIRGHTDQVVLKFRKPLH